MCCGNRMKSNFVIVIPSYNAGFSIEESISKILMQAPSAKIIIVDDNSPDGTGSLVSKLSKEDKRVTLLKRGSKAGRGSAVIAGFREGLKNEKNIYFLEMDADLCHDPKYIPSLVKNAQDADVVIASRYLPESKIFGWTLKRKLMSYAMNHFAKFFLRVPIRDYTDGYRCYSRRAVELIVNHEFKSKGYVVLSEIVHLCYKQNMVFAEIPIEFHFNLDGKSNLNIGEVKEALKTIIRLSLSSEK